VGVRLGRDAVLVAPVAFLICVGPGRCCGEFLLTMLRRGRSLASVSVSDGLVPERVEFPTHGLGRQALKIFYAPPAKLLSGDQIAHLVPWAVWFDRGFLVFWGNIRGGSACPPRRSLGERVGANTPRVRAAGT